MRWLGWAIAAASLVVFASCGTVMLGAAVVLSGGEPDGLAAAPPDDGAPGPAPNPDGLVCPLPGSTFTDTWLAPRPGGRVHRGVDMFHEYGEPVLAITAGRAESGWDSLGGIVVRLTEPDGTYHYLAHLSSAAVTSTGMDVEAGQVVGYNGDTGSAAGTPPHVHYQLHPNGRGTAPINPTPLMFTLCET